MSLALRSNDISVTKSYAKVRFDEDGVTKQLNLFKEREDTND